MTDADIQKMSDTAAELERLKLKQANIVKDINNVKSQTDAMDRRLVNESSDIEEATKKAEEQGEDARRQKCLSRIILFEQTKCPLFDENISVFLDFCLLL